MRVLISLITVIVFLFCADLRAQSPVKKTITIPSKKSVVSKANEIKTVKRDTINKNPRAIFLIKRTKVDSDIGEPVLYPYERQLSNIYFDIPPGDIRNE